MTDCGRFAKLEHGKIDFTTAQTTYRSSAPVVCDIGYKLSGGNSVQCQADGNWSKTVTCEIVGKVNV